MNPQIKTVSVPVMVVASNVRCITSSLNKMTRNCGRLEGSFWKCVEWKECCERVREWLV
jgi:hypothetical protein